MEEKITMPLLISLLSEKSGIGRNKCEDFIREFISVIRESLSAGESVRIKGIGVFKIVAVGARKSVDVNTGKDFEIPEHNKVVFVPAAELAERVNAPFDMFDTVEIDDEFSDDIFDSVGESEEFDISSSKVVNVTPSPKEDEEQLLEGIEYQEEVAPVAEEELETLSEDEGSIAVSVVTNGQSVSELVEIDDKEEAPNTEETDSVEKSFVLSACQPEDTNLEEEDYIPDDEVHEEAVSVKKKRGSLRFWVGIACGLILGFVSCILIGYLLGYLPLEQSVTHDKTVSLGKEKVENKSDVTAAKEVFPADSLASVDEPHPDVATEPSDKVVYDTISHIRYLTTMAKAHYGNYNLWPYIYEENSSFLGHPDRIRPGTRVVIPDLKKYGVDPANQEDIKKAKAKGVAIYARYGSSKEL